MIGVTKLRVGVTFVERGNPFRVVKYKHVHLSRGSGTVKVVVRNLRTGKLVNKTYKSGDRVEEIDVTSRDLQFLYADENGYVFMDSGDFSQSVIAKHSLGDMIKFLEEGRKYSILFWTNQKTGTEEVLDVDIPTKVELKVKEAAPGVKGDTAASVYKDAVLVNGLQLRVPLFVNAGDVVGVDTRTGKYTERIK